MSKSKDYSAVAKGLLKAELKLRNMTYADLVRALAASGVQETEVNLRNKISRGNFSASFFLQCLDVIGCDVIIMRPMQHFTARLAPPRDEG